MISQDQAERIAAAITTLRPDWLASSVTTLITRDLATWSLLDVSVGLTYVALDRKPDGSWASRTPGRVREQGPWRVVGIVDPAVQAQRDLDQRTIAANRLRAIQRKRDVIECTLCSEHGYLPNGNLCTHDERSVAGYRSPGAIAARQALNDARTARTTTPEEPNA